MRLNGWGMTELTIGPPKGYRPDASTPVYVGPEQHADVRDQARVITVPAHIPGTDPGTDGAAEPSSSGSVWPWFLLAAAIGYRLTRKK